MKGEREASYSRGFGKVSLDHFENVILEGLAHGPIKLINNEFKTSCPKTPEVLICDSRAQTGKGEKKTFKAGIIIISLTGSLRSFGVPTSRGWEFQRT